MKNSTVVLLAATQEHPLGGLLASSFEVVHVPTGAQAILDAPEFDPDVVLIQDALPDMTGFEACQRLRSEHRLPFSVPCLVLTGGTPTPAQRVSAVNAGAWDFVRESDDPLDLPLRLEAFAQARRNLDHAMSDGLTDPRTGLHTRNGLARRARQMGALLSRERGGLACLVLSLVGDVEASQIGRLVASAARVSDVVGMLAESEVAVLLPSTSQSGVVRAAKRIAAALRDHADTSTPRLTVRAGYDAVPNLSYTPIDPVELIQRAASAMHNGRPEEDLGWLCRYEPKPGVHAAL